MESRLRLHDDEPRMCPLLRRADVDAAWPYGVAGRVAGPEARERFSCLRRALTFGREGSNRTCARRWSGGLRPHNRAWRHVPVLTLLRLCPYHQQPVRTVTIIAAALAVLTVSSLGLNRGMVLHVDDHGHLALESAHVRHAHEHEEGADHEHTDFAGDADHAELHAAMAFDANACVVKTDPRTDSSALSAVADAAFLPHALASLLLPDLPSVTVRTGAGDFWGSTAHPELAPLGTVVLLV